MKFLLALFAALLLAGGRAHAQDPPNVFTSDVQMCSGRPWIDVTCNGADPTGVADSTTAIQNTINSAVTNDWPILFPAGTYKVTSKLTVEFGGQANSGPQIIAQGAMLDGRTVASGNVLSIQCSGGTTSVPVTCNHFAIRGWLTVEGSGAGYTVVIGKTDFSDRQNGVRIEHLVATNAGSGGAVQANYLTDSDLWLSGSTAGGSSSVGAVALEQVQTSKIGGYGSALGASAPALLIENGTSNNDAFVGFAYDPNSAVCISITSSTATTNTWLAPALPCTTAVNASASATKNVLISPTFSGTNRGSISTGISIFGRGSVHRYSAPAVASQTLYGSDDGTLFSSANATGPATGFTAASLPLTLPDPVQVGSGWTAAFVSDAGKAVTLTTAGGAKILARGKQLSSLTVGGAGNAAGNYEATLLQSDGATGFRVLYISQAAALLNGLEVATPASWDYPGGPGYQLTQGDNGTVISSAQASGTLTTTLPQTTAVAAGWTVDFSADANHALIVQTNGTNGGKIVTPNGDSKSFAVPLGAMIGLQFDGSDFRVRRNSQPFEADPMWFGARGDGVTDDYAAIQAALDSIAATGGTVRFRRSAGHYCVKGGTLHTGTPGITFEGANDSGGSGSVAPAPVVLDACDADNGIINFYGRHDKIANMKIFGSTVPNTTKPAVALTGGPGGCSECTIEDVNIMYGSNNVYADAYEVYLNNSSFDHPYGAAAVYFINTGGYMRKDKLDQAYPWGVPSPTTMGNWLGTHAYTAGNLVVNGYQTLQAMTSGTSGGSPPALVKYDTDIGDGGVTWRLVGAAFQNGVQIDTGGGLALSIDSTDFSASFNAAISMTNTKNGNNPGDIYLSNNTFYGNIENHISLGAGFSVMITANQFGNCVLTTCTEVSAFSPFQGDLSITGNQFVGAKSTQTGVFIGAGVYRTTIVGNAFGNLRTAISIGPGTSDFTITGNELGGSTIWGVNDIGIFLGAGADIYTIVGNNTTGISVQDILQTTTPTTDLILDMASPLLEVDGERGLTCGAPSGSFATKNGIVVHC